MESNPPGARKLGGHQQEKVMVVFGTNVKVIFSQRGPKPVNGTERQVDIRRIELQHVHKLSKSSQTVDFDAWNVIAFSTWAVFMARAVKFRHLSFLLPSKLSNFVADNVSNFLGQLCQQLIQRSSVTCCLTYFDHRNKILKIFIHGIIQVDNSVQQRQPCLGKHEFKLHLC